MQRNGFAQLSKLSDLSGRVDYIGNPERQEHLYATYSTVEGIEFWRELARVNHEEYEKYDCKGKVIEAREWIIALDESLVELDPNEVLQTFVDAFHDKYHVECIAALHHNLAMTNYHIHMIFAERRLLDEPIEKVATRNMFFDEFGKHKRTKKEILDENANIRTGCRIIKKGEVYEKQIFTAKDEIFKSKSFKAEGQKLFVEINNSLIADEKRKQTIFDSDSVYLPTKKIGKNNPMGDVIKKDNEQRKEWNLMVDQALISFVDRDEILEIKRKNIFDEIKNSIAAYGVKPELFSEIVKNAIDIIREKLRVMIENTKSEEPEEIIPVNQEVPIEAKEEINLPPKPVMPDLVKNFSHYEEVFKKIRKYRGEIYHIDKDIVSMKTLIKNCTSIFQYFEKKNYEKYLREDLAKREAASIMQNGILKQYGYTDVDSFMKLYFKSKNAKATYDDKVKK